MRLIFIPYVRPVLKKNYIAWQIRTMTGQTVQQSQATGTWSNDDWFSFSVVIKWQKLAIIKSQRNRKIAFDVSSVKAFSCYTKSSHVHHSTKKIPYSSSSLASLARTKFKRTFARKWGSWGFRQNNNLLAAILWIWSNNTIQKQTPNSWTP